MHAFSKGAAKFAPAGSRGPVCEWSASGEVTVLWGGDRRNVSKDGSGCWACGSAVNSDVIEEFQKLRIDGRQDSGDFSQAASLEFAKSTNSAPVQEDLSSSASLCDECRNAWLSIWEHPDSVRQMEEMEGKMLLKDQTFQQDPGGDKVMVTPVQRTCNVCFVAQSPQQKYCRLPLSDDCCVLMIFDRSLASASSLSGT